MSSLDSLPSNGRRTFGGSVASVVPRRSVVSGSDHDGGMDTQPGHENGIVLPPFADAAIIDAAVKDFALSGNSTCDAIGHDEEVFYDEDDPDSYVWRCNRCGAEGWSD